MAIGKKIGEFFDEYFWEFLLASVTGVGFLFIGLIYEVKPEFYGIEYTKYGKWVIIVSLLLFILSYIMVQRKSISIKKCIAEKTDLEKKVSVLEDDIQKVIANAHNIFHDYIGTIFKGLTFGDSERISVYKHFGDHFEILSRFSTNPKIAAQSCPYYSDSEGFIGKGWQQETFEIYGLPDPLTNETAYIEKVCTLCNIPKGVLKKIKMKSRSYFIVSIFDDRKTAKKAIIVFESQKPTKFDTEGIIKYLDNNTQSLLPFIANLAVNNKSAAKNAGF